jgi:uncharacterized protein (DUF885 family)
MSAAPTPPTPLQDRIAAFFDELFPLDPVRATATGDHRFDHIWPDMTEAGRQARLTFVDRWEAELGGFDPERLSAADRADREVLLSELAAMRFADTELREERWDPMSWVYLLGSGIFPILAREFAPPAARLASIAGRLESMPHLLENAEGQLQGHGDRPVSKLHAETALKNLAGIAELADDAVKAGEAAEADADVRAILPRLRHAAETAKVALNRFEAHLQDKILPRAEGEGRLGRDLFDRKMRHTLKSDLSPLEILDRANREYVAVRREMVRLAREHWTRFVPDRPMPTAASAGTEEAADSEIVRGVLDAIAAQHQSPERMLDFCREELARIEAFCREKDLIGLAEEPLQIMWTPVFLRSFGGAMLDSPGPLDKKEKAFFAVTPIPDDWTPEQKESYLREDNDRMLQLLVIHEAVPGHYLQGVYSNRCSSLARTILWSGVFAEGWAVYVTQVMMDAGYGGNDPALWLTHWKFYLRATTNAIIDVKIHTMDMTEDEAVSLMVDGGFQEEAEARAKWNRARLSSTQLVTYFVGSMEMWDIELERRRQLAVETAGPSAAEAVPVPRIVGGLGATPGFLYRTHLEEVLSHGSPPMPVIRQLLLEERIPA